MTAVVLRADARSLPLPDDSVDLVVTSPPYFALRSYQDGGEHYDGQIGSEATPAEFVAALLDVTRECMRVLKPTGSLWINLGDKYASNPGQGFGGMDLGTTDTRTAALRRDYRRGRRSAAVPLKSLMGLPWRYALGCIDQLGLILRAEVIWSKPSGLPESVTDRVRRSHEQWFHFTLQPRYYSSVDEIREPHARQDPPRPMGTRNKTPRHTLAADYTGWKDHSVSNHTLGKLPGSVREIASRPLTVPEHLGVDHFAAFPVDWPLWITRGWSPPGGVVLDPFGGTGTTALAASVLGRRGISVDLSSDYCRLAQWRTTDPGERARALGKPKPEPIPDEQLSLELLSGGAV